MDTKGALRDIHRRVGTAILFESSAGQVDKVAHLPELRFVIGERDVETTVDNRATALAKSGFLCARSARTATASTIRPDPAGTGQRVCADDVKEGVAQGRTSTNPAAAKSLSKANASRSRRARITSKLVASTKE